QSTPDWAAEVRRQTFPRNPPAAPFFLVVARDRTYIWTRADATAPAIEVATSELLDAYLKNAGTSAEKIPPSTLELITGSWLVDLTLGLPKAAENSVVRDSGLASAVQDRSEERRV